MVPAKHTRIIALALLLALAGGALPAVAGASPAGTPIPGNLLTNASWENGFHKQNNVNELGIPDGWTLYYLDRETFPGIADGYLAYRPETVVWYRGQAPGNERDLFWLDGDYTLKIFKGFAPVYAALAQDVSGLQVGQRYTFTAPIYVDIYADYRDGQKVPPGSGGMVRLGVSLPGAAWRNESQIAYTGWLTEGNTPNFYLNYTYFSYTFTATASTMTVWAEMASKFGFGNNGFFMDNWSLLPVGGAAATTSAPTAAPAASTASTAATTATGAAGGGDTFYTDQRGDTLTSISKKFGVSISVIKQANNLTSDIVRLGKVLRIPGVPSATSQQYTVQKGDSLGSIARKFNVTAAAILAVNSLSNPNRIYPGQVINIP